MESIEFETGSVWSSDGTPIGYRRIGRGPGVILVHGAMMTGRMFDGLARALAQDFTVYAPDRRGRGMSGTVGPDYGIEAEIEDLAAVLRETGARYVFGLSSGAVIALRSALALPQISKLALYEPPLSVGGVSPLTWAPRFERELDEGRIAAAFATILQGTADVRSFASLPRFVLRPLTTLMMRLDIGAGMPVRDLVPTGRYDVQIVRNAGVRWADVSELRCDTLLLGGSKSVGYLKPALDQLHTVLPDAGYVMLPGVGHTAAFTDEQPELVAVELRRFFG
ncbi:alpha/beta fold hydrolase [Nocardia colli]|uniref:alpha/beta fold hydrolase n=1 Tax=Nocardia colli TaxID=2545717 RepID=UPI001CC7E7F0|nr:alpha/beta hydrolase [Nocardia colli]